MSREIKFRAWNLTYKWMEDSFFISSGGVAYDVPSRTFDTPNTEIEEAPNYVLMQFTGLRDVNGIEIYEGDIIQLNDEWVSVVEYRHAGFCVLIDSIYTVAGPEVVDISEWETIKVIGNIHEHPHLLDEAK